MTLSACAQYSLIDEHIGTATPGINVSVPLVRSIRYIFRIALYSFLRLGRESCWLTLLPRLSNFCYVPCLPRYAIIHVPYPRGFAHQTHLPPLAIRGSTGCCTHSRASDEPNGPTPFHSSDKTNVSPRTYATANSHVQYQ